MAAGRFVIDCDPTRGGQVIVASIGLDQPVNCLLYTSKVATES